MSWIIVSKATGRPVLETFSAALLKLVNVEKYEIHCAQDWLARFNQQIAEHRIDETKVQL